MGAWADIGFIWANPKHGTAYGIGMIGEIVPGEWNEQERYYELPKVRLVRDGTWYETSQWTKPPIRCLTDPVKVVPPCQMRVGGLVTVVLDNAYQGNGAQWVTQLRDDYRQFVRSNVP